MELWWKWSYSQIHISQGEWKHWFLSRLSTIFHDILQKPFSSLRRPLRKYRDVLFGIGSWTISQVMQFWNEVNVFIKGDIYYVLYIGAY